MQVVQDDLWLCVDCTIAAVNGDVSGIDSDARVAEVWAGLAKLGPHLVPDFDSESGEGHEDFMAAPALGCASCASHLAGEFHRFATLEPVPTWHVVTSQGGIILGVFGSALLSHAQECARRVERQTGFPARVEQVTGERPAVGQPFK